MISIQHAKISFFFYLKFFYLKNKYPKFYFKPAILTTSRSIINSSLVGITIPTILESFLMMNVSFFLLAARSGFKLRDFNNP